MDLQQIRQAYNKAANRYDILDKPIEMTVISRLRKRLLSLAQGNVLEVAIGTGANLPYYPAHLEITGVDASEEMLKHARSKAYKYGKNVELIQMDVQSLAFPDSAFDTVVCSLALCTVPQPTESLRQMARVLKPDGRILLLEHVKSSNRLVAWAQKKASPAQEKRMGCSFVRNTTEAVIDAGLRLESFNKSFFGVMTSIVAKI